MWVGCLFNSSIRLQTLYSGLWNNPDSLALKVQHGVTGGEWSAPLDDVFIHFDFARATARGHPFEWSEGNGYSSGGTSLLYPFTLAIGYRVGFRGLELMLWAGVIACVSVLATLLGARRMFRELPRFAVYLLPLVFLSVGALDWTLWSGMEVALLLALWVGALIAWDRLIRDVREGGSQHLWPRALELGLWGAAVVATRPEGIGAMAVFAAGALIALRERLDRVKLGTLLALGLAPSALILLGHAALNWWLTGDTAAAGALVKLELHHPRLSAREVLDAWVFHLKYQVLRVTHYHLTDVPVFGWIPWLFAAIALAFKATRRYALVLWATAALWVLTVALNGQVRWQNERYTMPAVAWLLMASALGLGAALSHTPKLSRRGVGAGVVVACVALSALFVWHQLPRFREQLWFFGRASRNILDQHVRTGRVIREVLRSDRVLVGDAGAIPYITDLPALDIIGLGGYRGLPFARATRENVAAAIELIERIPKDERPDLLAIYPSWWGDFPLWFGTRVTEVPVRGNVICGGASKVLYQPRWEPLEASAKPFSIQPGERVVDGLDFADLVSEKEHAYAPSQRGDVAMKLLQHPLRPSSDLWDAGRVVPPGTTERFRLRGVRGKSALIVRVAPFERTAFDVRVNGDPIGKLELYPSDGWRELRLELGSRLQGSEQLELTFGPSDKPRTLFQLWTVEAL